MNNISVIGGNGYTICSGSYDKTIRIWDIETTKQLNIFKRHEHWIRSVKYGSNELLNTILSGSYDKSVRLWDIRSSEQIQVFNGHTNTVYVAEYSSFSELYVIKGDSGIMCLKFLQLKKNEKKRKFNDDIGCGINLCYGSCRGFIYIWG
ncbi:hypothetical protein RFI_15039 [Reticulomyxa filosa]|uniref:Uncharacterized protein n=1 Tax=Reticulomyxa filosa TaxID=46433 RepID=X6N793_RETFI|nr:hypothetical protein RFI_15039 [Reticulomyxa filosa]|eukprot:ETO22160.1 hypothetical protein RFI_15039 [Reticulomyxa filosa]